MGRLARSFCVLFAVAITSLPAWASDRSISLYSQGLVEFHAGNLPAARELMERAVDADPQDPYAAYYRGVVRVRMGEIGPGTDDLRRALSIKPDFPEGQLDLGVALVNEGQYTEAASLLEKASRDPMLRANATLFLGIAKLRQGEAAASLGDFGEAQRLDPKLATTATYYRGIALHQTGQSAEARASFEDVIAARPDSEIAREAKNYLSLIDTGQSQAKRYEIHGGYGLDYDSNVVLRLRGETIESLGVESDWDVGMSLGLGGRYALWRGNHTAVSVGYDFFQRVYLQLDDYNLQAHRPNIHWTGSWNSFRFGLIGQYEFYLLKNDAYLHRLLGQPWVAWHAGEWGRTELSYRVRWNDFLKTPPGGVPVGGIGDFADSEDALDSVVHQPRLRQYFYLGDPRRYVSISYQYELRDPSKTVGAPFGFQAHGAQIAASTPVIGDLDLFLSYSYTREDYDEGGRVDQPHGIIATLRWPLANWFAVSVGYYGEIHNSNRFAYDRHVASTGFDLFF